MTDAPPPALRDATRDDVAALTALERASFDDPWGEASVTAEVTGTDRLVRVLEASEGLAGWSSTSIVADTADLLRVAVDPAARRHGLGRLLVDDVLRSAAAGGAARVLLEVAETNVAARALYAVAGFREIHRRRRYYPDGGDALVLERVLP